MGYLIAEIPECREYLIPGTWASEAKLELATNLALRQNLYFRLGMGVGQDGLPSPLASPLHMENGQLDIKHLTPNT